MKVDRFDPTPLYIQVADRLRERVRRGEFEPRVQLPSESMLVADYGIARETARRAIAVLRQEGLVVTLPQRGTFVAPAPDS
ncbi:GntR family transcriptional regulator [Nocardiopsis sp. JB363]|uniref:GntR family transcriptional regulator n=1 Tax=Nocardiopsis sp. JB363 TaxID=1434837 RepID=UPI000B35D5E3|nr:GntR family transcriptional regulator [Nocardiopsis sp. JB363]